MATAFYGGNFFGGEFFSSSGGAVTPAAEAPQAGVKHHPYRRKRKVIVNGRLYTVRDDGDLFRLFAALEEKPELAQPKPKAKARRDDVAAGPPLMSFEPRRIEMPVEIPGVNWAAIRAQLAQQDKAYTLVLERYLREREEDDIEVILLFM